MLVVANHHVIVPQIEDVAYKTTSITALHSDTIRIELYGDSIMCGRNPDRLPPSGGVCNGDSVTARVPMPPAELLLAYLPQYKIISTTRSVGGSSSANLLNGTDGVNGAWPDDINANVVVVNHGLNDARTGVTLNQYRTNLIALRDNLPANLIMVWQTPAPNLYWNTAQYAAVMREVAQQYGDSVSDIHRIPNWTNLLPDGIHPRQLGYAKMIDLELSGAVNTAIVQHISRKSNTNYRKNYAHTFQLENSNTIALPYMPRSSSWLEVYKRDSPKYRIVSRGSADTYSNQAAGLYDYVMNIPIFLAETGFNLYKIDRNTGRVVYNRNYTDVTALADDLNRTSIEYVVILTTKGDVKDIRTNPVLLDAVRRCGAGTAIYESTNFRRDSAYILVGIPGSGVNSGYEAYNGSVDNDVIAYAEMLIEMSPSGYPVVIDIFPPVAEVYNQATNETISLIDPMYNMISNVAPVNGFRLVNARYSPVATYDQYNVTGNVITFTSNVSGIYTVITDTSAENISNSLTININDIQSVDNYVYRFNPLRWASGKANVIAVNTTVTSLSPPTVVGASGVNSLGIYNTKITSRVGDAYRADPVVISQPQNGYVKLSQDRKSFVYAPFPDFVGLDSFSYTLITQRGQQAPAKCVYIEVTHS